MTMIWYENATPTEGAHMLAADALVAAANDLVSDRKTGIGLPKSRVLPALKAIIRLHDRLVEKANLIDGLGMSPARRLVENLEGKDDGTNHNG